MHELRRSIPSILPLILHLLKNPRLGKTRALRPLALTRRPRVEQLVETLVEQPTKLGRTIRRGMVAL